MRRTQDWQDFECISKKNSTQEDMCQEGWVPGFTLSDESDAGTFRGHP